ncbi:alpha/beta fold hydrolase [Streptomyces sp. NPDC046465]|uniref:alpha/beta hydrolase family protein n=1 Tax=Streptomyces sp. NPDC046465 TaxID=3155810 RepID=UPI0033D2089A
MTLPEPVGELPLLLTAELPDGTRLPVRGLRAPAPERFLPSGSGPAPGPPPAPAVLILPAMGTAARYYRRFARQLHDEGLTVLTVDLRGQGESAPGATGTPGAPADTRHGALDHGYRAIVEEDLPAVVAAIRDELGPEPPLHLLGHSLGGQLGLVYAAVAQGTPGRSGHSGRPGRPGRPGVDGVALVATGSVWYRAFGPLRGVGLFLFQLLVTGAVTVLGRWPGTRLGFGGDQPKGVMRDWARQVRTGRYRAKGSALDYEAALGALELPVLAVSVEQDGYAPVTALDHLLGKVPQARLTRRHYTTQEAGRRLDHFAWTRAGATLAKRVAAWTADEERPGTTAVTGR